MFAEDIIIKPVLTEKAYDGIASKSYTFIASVNTVTCKGRRKRMGRYEGYTPDRKKAIVTLKEDSKPIEFFESLA